MRVAYLMLAGAVALAAPIAASAQTAGGVFPDPCLSLPSDRTPDDNDSSNGVTTLTQVPGAAATACPGGSVPVWADCVEVYLGTVIDDNCPTVPGPGPGGDSNPPDTNVDGNVNILDVFPMFPFWLSPVTAPSVRYNLNADGSINILDVFPMFPSWLSTCT